MKKTKKVLLAGSMFSILLAPAAACNKNDDDTTQTEKKISKGTTENGTFSLVVDSDTNKITVNATPNTGYELDRAYYTFDNDKTLEYAISENGFTQPEGAITVYALFKKIKNSSDVSIDSNISNGSVSIATTNYVANQELTINVTANTGYRLKRLYYTNNSNTETEIVNKKFTWDGNPVTIKAEFVSYYGSYLLSDVSGVENEIKELILETGKYSFAKIGNKLEVGAVDQDITTKYISSTFDYTLNENTISYQDAADLVTMTLTDNGFTMSVPEIEAVLHYELATPFAFENTRYTHTNNDGSLYPVQEYEFRDNGEVYIISSNDDYVEQITQKLGTYTLHGNLMVINTEGGETYVGTLTLENGVYSFEGLFIANDNGNEISMTFEKSYSSINIEQAPHGLISINPKYKANDTINVVTMIEKGYRLKRLYYVKSDGSEVVVNNNQFVWDGSNIELKAEFVNFYGSYVFDEVVGDAEQTQQMALDTAYSVFSIGDTITIAGTGSDNNYRQGEFNYALVKDQLAIQNYTTITLTDNGFYFVSGEKTIKYKLVENFEIKLKTSYVITTNTQYQMEVIFYDNGLFREIDTSLTTGKTYYNQIQGTYKMYGDIIILNVFELENYTYVGKLSLDDTTYTLDGFIFAQDPTTHLYQKQPINWELKESSLVNFEYPVKLMDSENGTYDLLVFEDESCAINAWADQGYQLKRVYYTNLDNTDDTTEYLIENIHEFTLPAFKIALYVEFEPITQ